MRLCLLGDFSGTPDEGMKNISRTTYELLSSRHEVMVLAANEVFNPVIRYWLKEFNPQIMHYLHGPTIRSLALLKWLKTVTGSSTKTVVSATRPYFSRITQPMVSMLKPDLILTQSEKFENFFKNHGLRVAFFPNGVDLDKFSRVSDTRKDWLREGLGFPLDKKIILHVGHIKPNRKLDFFIDLQRMAGIQVVIAGGTHEKSDKALKQRLIDAGVMVIHEYMDDISILYKASDLYVFPITDDKTRMPDAYNQIGAIDLPLSILEAMGCNLPVITTRFGALPRLFKEKKGFTYADSREDIIRKIKPMLKETDIGTRTMVEPLDWNYVIRGLERRYKMIIQDFRQEANVYAQTGFKRNG